MKRGLGKPKLMVTGKILHLILIHAKFKQKKDAKVTKNAYFNIIVYFCKIILQCDAVR
jgi:hypothetical protein